jgi:conjugal transfer pilus assembly protein TraA
MYGIIIMKKLNMNTAKRLLAGLAPVGATAHVALGYSAGDATAAASTTATDAGMAQLDSLLINIINWLEGPLGTLLAIAALLIGLGIGIMNQSIAAVILGIAMGAIVNYGAEIIQGISGEATAAL